MRCPECGYKAEADYRYCQRCGHPLSAVAQTTPRTSDNRRAEVSGKRRLWQRITFGLDKSIGGCIALIVVGVVICGIGYMMLSWSTLLQWSEMRTSEYVNLYRQTGLMPWQWCLAVIGIAINITGIAVAYIAIKSCMERIPSANRQDSGVAKVVAVGLCVATLVIALLLKSAICDRGTPLSIWDYLILYVIWRGIWRGIVGVKKTKKRSA